MARRRVVITGIGTVSPVGLNVESTWASILGGRSGIGKITRFDTTDMPAKIAGEVKNFDPKTVLEIKEIKKHDLFSQFSIAAATEAWENAKLASHKYDQCRMGCILGVGLGGLATLEEYHKAYLEGGPKKISPFLIPKMISNLGPGNIAIRFGLKGVNFTISSACTSSTHALGESFRMISSGIQDVVVTGGSESTITPIGIGGFCAMKALSTRNEEPERASRPFDKERDGFVMGEGAAILILESLDHAKARGAKIHAEILGYGASCDAFHITSPSTEGDGAVACMQGAHSDAGIPTSQVDYINAHGTSTPYNDSIESGAIERLFGENARKVAVSSTKSMTGHLLGAAGAVEALFCTLAIRDKVLPPTINLENPDEACRLDYVPNKARPCDVKITMSNSFGFGGTNASIVIGRFNG